MSQTVQTEWVKNSNKTVPTGEMKQTVTTGSIHATDRGKNAGTSSAECEHMTTPLNSSVQDITTAGSELSAVMVQYSSQLWTSMIHQQHTENHWIDFKNVHILYV